MINNVNQNFFLNSRFGVYIISIHKIEVRQYHKRNQ